MKNTPEYAEDANGNRCYVSYFGTLDAAMADLRRLAALE